MAGTEKGPQRFRKKPVEVEAVQLTDRNGVQVEQWVGSHCKFYDRGVIPGHTSHVVISTPEGAMYGQVGDWIIRGVKGEFYPCKPDVFASTYEAVGS